MKRLSNNWNLKLMALLFAVVLWSHVRGEVNPWETATFKVNLRVERADLPRKLTITDSSKIPPFVTVTVRGPRLALREMKGPSLPGPLASPEENIGPAHGQLRASLDFSHVKTGEQNLPVKVDVKVNDVEVIAIKPSDAVVTLDQAAVAPFIVEAQFSPALVADYIISRVGVEPATVEVAGPSDVLKRVAHVRARVRNLKGSGAVRLERVPLVATDADGDAIANVLVNPETATVTATLRENRLERRLPVAPQVVGVPVTGYEVKKIEVIPPSLLLSGLQRAFTGKQTLTIPVTVQGNTASWSKQMPVALPSGLTAPDGATVTVRVRIGPAGHVPVDNSGQANTVEPTPGPVNLPKPASE